MSRYEVLTRTVEDKQVFVLVDRHSEAEAQVVPALGNNAIAFSVRNFPLLFSPPNLETLQASPSRYGVPVLFPPNRTRNAAFTYAGQTYEFPPNNGEHYIHGELCRRPWVVENSGASDSEGAYLVSVFEFERHPDMMAVFPHPLVFRFTYRLLEGKLTLEGAISNGGSKEAPFGLGFHPYFTSSSDAVVTVPARSEFPVADNFVTAQDQATGLCKSYRDGVPDADIEHSVYALFRMDEGTNRSAIHLPSLAKTIVYETDGAFPFMVAFKPAWGTAISLEPYSIVTDGFNLPWPADVTGVRGVPAGEEIRFLCSIYAE